MGHHPEHRAQCPIRHPENDCSHMEQNRLKRMESHSLDLVVRSKNQKDNTGDQSKHITECTSDILAQPASGGPTRSGRRRSISRLRSCITRGRTTLWTEAPRRLCPALWTKCHK